MTYAEVHAAADGQLGPYCKNCPVCNGKACGNSIPGPGSKFPGNTAERNYEKWQEITVNMDTLNPNCCPDTSFEMFGHVFKAPVFVAPLGALPTHYGPKYQEADYNALMVKAAAEYGLMGFTGDGTNPEILKSAASDMQQVGGIGCPTIKPWTKEIVFEKLDILHEKNPLCVAMDIDGAGLPFLRNNPDAGSKTVDEMKEIISYAGRPFIIKGIMTAAGAGKALEAGAKGIVVSNHGGRVQGGCPSTAEVLPEIADVVKGKLTILVDGGIRSGVDVFRALALGADGVLIGRPVLNSIYGAGAEGFRVYMDKIIDELQSTMIMCGCPDLKHITKDNIRL